MIGGCLACSSVAVTLQVLGCASGSMVIYTMYDATTSFLYDTAIIFQNPECVCAPCRAGVQLSKVEVKFNNLEVSADVNIGNRGMPTVANAFIHTPLVRLPWLHTHAHSALYVPRKL
jgi:hypothetical protein